MKRNKIIQFPKKFVSHLYGDSYNIVALSKPNKGIIYSLVTLTNFHINEEVLERLSQINIKNLLIFFIEEDGESDIKNLPNNNSLVFLTKEDFFNLKTFNLILKNNSKYQNIFVFKNIDWNEITFFFKELNLDLSGGSNNKKHLLSPIQYKLSLFIWILKGNQGMKSITESFNIERYSNDKKLLNYFSKENKQILKDYRNKMLK